MSNEQLVMSNEEQNSKNKLLLERQKIVLTSQEYKDLIKICETEDWQISKEMLKAFKEAEKLS